MIEQKLRIVYSPTMKPKDTELARLQWQAEVGRPLVKETDKDGRLVITELPVVRETC